MTERLYNEREKIIEKLKKNRYDIYLDNGNWFIFLKYCT